MSHFSTRTLGEMVAVGATDTRSVRIWVRTHEAGPHGVEIWNDTSQLHHTVALAPPVNADGTTSFVYPDDIPGAMDLPPGVAFQARVRRGATILGTVSFETAPANAATVPPNVAFAFASCHQPFDDDGSLHTPSLATLDCLDAALRERNVKRVLLMGDQMYADYPPKQSLFEDAYFATVAPPGRSSILDCTRDEVRALYQRRYHAWWSIEPFQQLLASYPCYPVPDDHEIRDNFGSAPEHATDAWLAVRDGALDAFDDYQGQLTAPRASPRRKSFDYALTYADIAIYGLDVRSQRRHDGTALHVCTDEQFTALERFLAASTSSSVLMLVTSVPLAMMAGTRATWARRSGRTRGSRRAAPSWCVKAGLRCGRGRSAASSCCVTRRRANAPAQTARTPFASRATYPHADDSISTASRASADARPITKCRPWQHHRAIVGRMMKALLFTIALTACGGSKSPPAEPAPVGHEQGSDTSMTAQQCTDAGGEVVGDIGDGAIHKPDYRCVRSGEPPLGHIAPEPGKPAAIEGAVCCK